MGVCFCLCVFPKPKILFDAYNDVVTNQKFQPLIVDMTSDCPDNMRLRANIFPYEMTIIYSPTRF